MRLRVLATSLCLAIAGASNAAGDGANTAAIEGAWRGGPGDEGGVYAIEDGAMRVIELGAASRRLGFQVGQIVAADLAEAPGGGFRGTCLSRIPSHRGLLWLTAACEARVETRGHATQLYFRDIHGNRMVFARRGPSGKSRASAE